MMDIERGMDGMIGRMLSWLVQAPMRSSRSESIETLEELVSDTVIEPVEGVSRVVNRATEKIIETVEKPLVEAADALEQKILTALNSIQGGAGMKQLQKLTGGKPTTLRTRLAGLSKAGKVERRGKGMRTRYHLRDGGKIDEQS